MAGAVAGPSLVEAMSHAPPRGLPGALRKCGVYLATPDKFCNRLNSLQQYIEVNREVSQDRAAVPSRCQLKPPASRAEL